MNELTPPAIVCRAKRNRTELNILVTSRWNTYGHHGNKLLEAGRDLGEVLLELREDCDRAGIGEWSAELDRLGIPLRTAQRVIKNYKDQVAPVSATVALTGEVLEEELSAHLVAPVEASESTSEEQPPPSPKPPTGSSSNPAAGLLKPPTINPIRCQRCTNKGLPGNDCPSCVEMRREVRATKLGPPAAPAEVEKPPAILCPACKEKGSWRKDCVQCLLLNMVPKTQREPGEDDGWIDSAYELYGADAALSVPFENGMLPTNFEVRLVAASEPLRKELDAAIAAI
jgi:hypothetical protein